MNLLLDTHILLWILQVTPALGREARRLLERPGESHVSAVSLWEIAIKHGLGKLAIDLQVCDARLAQMPFGALAISWSHTRQLRRLPPLHADPFDRMLVAQTICDSLNLFTRDAALNPYSELLIAV